MNCSLRNKGGAFYALSVLLMVAVWAISLNAQSKYRTFSQQSLSEKKAHAGKSLGSKVTFTFDNDTIHTRYGIQAIVSAPILAVLDSGGFSSVQLDANKRSINLSGTAILPRTSVSVSFWVKKKDAGTQVNYWWWSNRDNEHILPTHTKLDATSDAQLYTQPNGGNVREYIYKKIIIHPIGVVMGIARPDSAKYYGWIRYKSPDRKFFPDTGHARCFDVIMKNNGIFKPFVGELKNPHATKYNNHLNGEAHALRLAVIANDAGVTEPADRSFTRLGDLIYDNTGNPTDPYNGYTIRQLLFHADSLLTFCGAFPPDEYVTLDSTISRINRAFDGSYEAVSFDPFLLAGTHALGEVPWLLPNPSVSPVGISHVATTIIDETPEQFELRQNYPNPFNPTTTIEFNVGDDPAVVTLKIYDVTGREVATIMNEEEIDGGEQMVNFNASGLSSGVYFYRVTARGTGEEAAYYHDSRKMLLLK